MRVAVVAPELRVGNVAFNVDQILLAMENLKKDGVQLAVFPELSLTAYTCGDLFYQTFLREQAWQGLERIARAANNIVAVVGLPVEHGGRLYNCAAVVGGGKVLGLVPKTFLPTTQEYYEERWFTAAPSLGQIPEVAGVPFGTDLLFAASNQPDCVLGVEICEDLWAVQPPSGGLALGGATILINPSASNEVLGKARYRRELVQQQSARCLAAYLYASAGPGESSMDTVYSGHTLIVEAGILLAEGARLEFETQILTTEIDVARLVQERLRNSSYSAAMNPERLRRVHFELPSVPAARRQLRRVVNPSPFVPAVKTERAEHCQEVLAIQTAGLVKRLRHLDGRQVVLGLSGGLDSTLALLVTVRAFDQLGWNRAGIVAITMPGFGTSERTRNNADQLAQLFQITLRTIPIDAAVRQHFTDIGHQETKHNVVYENAQARERTQILMDVANQVQGFVVGTGDLSEAALGWCTFNGDHLSMYHVNAGVPKTLVRYLIESVAAGYLPAMAKVLLDIASTPISPELLPVSKTGKISQKTEEVVGPYELHDFFLFYFVRYHFSPEKILWLAQQAFAGRYSEQVLRQWLTVFLRRFMSQQFKRSAMPDGPKVGSVALSPRADWRMPSDADYLTQSI